MPKPRSRKLQTIRVYKRHTFAWALSCRRLVMAVTLASLAVSPIRGLAQTSAQEDRGLKQTTHSTQSNQPNPSSSQVKPDLILQAEEIMAERDLVAIRWSSIGTHRGEFAGVPPSGKRAATTGITLLRIYRGVITEVFTNWDALGLMKQIGAVH